MPGVIDQSKTDTPQRPPVAAAMTATPAPASPMRRVGPPPDGELPALLIDGVTKRFVTGRRKRKTVVAINEVSMRIRRGEIYGILGANGSGKSTLIRLVSTLLTLDGGRIEVLGHDVARHELAVKRLVNRVSVDAAFFKKFSPFENLSYSARPYRNGAKSAKV